MRNITMADWKVTRKQKKLIKQVLKSGRLTYGEKTKELEERFAEIHGANHALFTSSGTAALKIALHALKDKYGWKDGDEVIIPAVTFVATMNVVIMNNLVPVLVDVLPQTVNMNPMLLEKAITKKTRAIIPVHLLGQPADMDSIMEIAKKHKLKVIEDSCETMFVNKIRGDVACFSTYLAHLLVTGIGGFITTNDKKLATVMRSMMFHGRDESYLNIDDKPTDISKRFYFPRFGYSDRMTELEAALGLAELDGWEDMIEKRQENAKYLLLNLPMQVDSPVEDHTKHSFMFFPMYVDDRDNLMIHLEKKGIQTRTMMPLINQPLVKPYLKKSYPIADMIGRKGLLIGCHQYLKKVDLDYIIDSIGEYYNGK
jgi:dTDP-4-amino-4,6-dideoxygalactose transaminase